MAFTPNSKPVRGLFKKTGYVKNIYKHLKINKDVQSYAETTKQIAKDPIEKGKVGEFQKFD